MHEQPGVIAKCWRDGMPYEAPLLEHIREQRFRGLALDVGANIGNHALWLSLVCGLPVIAFEPLHHEALRRNVTLNQADIDVRPYGLSNLIGKAYHVGKGKLAPGSGTVELRTLDSLNLENVAVMKVDVEDMESFVFRGGERTIRRDRPVIYAEARSDANHRATAAVLKPWGYRRSKVFSQRGWKGTWTPMEEWRAS